MKQVIRVLVLLLAAMSLEVRSEPLYAPGRDLSILGTGFDSTTKQLRTPCVVGVRAHRPHSELSFVAHYSKDFEQMIKERRATTAAGVDIWLVAGNVESEFLVRTTETTQRVSYVLSVDYDKGLISLEDRSLARGLSKTKQASLCGDEFVYAARMGARLYLALTLHFNTHEEYQRFRTTVSASAFGGLFKKEKSWSRELKNVMGSARLSVDALQLGGNDAALRNLVASGPNFCSQDDIDLCVAKARSIYAYAAGENGFKDQIASLPPEKLYPLFFVTESYERSGHGDPAAPREDRKAPPGFHLVVTQLSVKKVQWINERTQLEARYAGQTLDPATKSQFEAEAQALRRKVAKVDAVLRFCQEADTAEACMTRAANEQLL